MRLHQRQHDAIISIHALRKESDNDGIGGAFASPISIHALRKESDQDGAHNVKQAKEFQSTLSVRRATQMDGAIVRLVVISIHALRKESDVSPPEKASVIV